MHWSQKTPSEKHIRDHAKGEFHTNSVVSREKVKFFETDGTQRIRT